MDTSKFAVTSIGPGLNVHSTKISENTSFHIAVSAQFSTEELPVAEMRRELMIEIDGLNDHQRRTLMKDLRLISTNLRVVGNLLSFAISNKALEQVYDRVIEVAGT